MKKFVLFFSFIFVLTSCMGEDENKKKRAEVDKDGDGYTNSQDAFPENPNEHSDLDADGVGDNGDVFPMDASESGDADGDGVGNNSDIFPYNSYESADTDGDSVGDNSDHFPYDSTEFFDTDGDGIGNNGDHFPYDWTETVDTDGDGVGDNGDVFPNNGNESKDTDKDGIGDNSDIDIDGDGILNEDDEQPFEINYGGKNYPYTLELNRVQSGTVKAQVWQYFKVVSAPDTMLNVTVSGLSNDVDLYVSEGEVPEQFNYDCRSNEAYFSNETCLQRVNNRTLYYIAVYARENANFQILATNQEIVKKKAVLLLHGLASTPSTWSSMVNDDSFFNGSCLEMNFDSYLDLADVPAANKDGVHCFNLEFGSLDRGSYYSAIGLDGKVCNRVSGCNGDYTTFDGLAVEVSVAVMNIVYILGEDTEVFLLGHSRGGLAARAYLQSPAVLYTELVSGMATIGTPHQGSPLGRVYKYMQNNCIPKIVYRQDNGKCEDNWETIEMIAGEREFFGFNYSPEYHMDMHAPSIDYLSPESVAITSLNRNLSALSGKVLGGIRYEGTTFGVLAQGYDLYDYGTWFAGDHPHPSLLTYVENGQTRASYMGDGIVPASSQNFYNVLSGSGIYLTVNIYNTQANILHTDETSKVTIINTLFSYLYPALGWKE